MKLKITGITFKYASEPILKNVTMELGKREILGLIGPNGAGKSTLIKCIDKILKPLGGSILLDGQEIRKMTRREIAKHIGYVPQTSSGCFPATVFDTVLMGRYPRTGWGSSDRDIEKVAEVMELLKIERFALRNFNTLSGGEKQKVMLARALAQEPKVLLLDEPTSNLDIKHQLEVMEVIRDIVRYKGISAVVAIHDLNLAARYADKLVMLHKGGIFAGGYPESVLTYENIKKIYGVEAEVKKGPYGLYVLPLKPASYSAVMENRVFTSVE